MGLDEFTEEAIWRLKKELGSGCRIEKKTFDGINGTKKHSLLVADAGADIFPCLNMGEYYKWHEEGEPFDSLFETMLSECRKAPPLMAEEMSEFLYWDSIKGRIFAKLVNTEKNERLLREIPHRQCMDLSLVYYARAATKTEGLRGSILIRNGHMERWGTDERALFQAAWENMERADEMRLENMESVLNQLLDETDFIPCGSTGDFMPPRIAERPRMYVLGNKDRVNGAVQMCSRRALKRAADRIGSDFWILPSSVHELILIPVYETEGDVLDLAEMVREVNNTQLQPDEILSYHVYRYSRDTETLSIEA